MADERKWEDLQTDCLINIFTRVDTETLAESVQYVCKSWYKTTLYPQCWQNIVFTSRLCSYDYIQFVVDRSQLSATSVTLRPYPLVSDQFWFCIALRCPLLKNLDIPAIGNESIISELIRFWKNLECIKLRTFNCLPRLLDSISIHCKNFTELCIVDSFSEQNETLLIAKYVPKIKVLRMHNCELSRWSLEVILRSCTELEVVDISDCVGFDEMDAGILKLASHIKCFSSSGSTVGHCYADGMELTEDDNDSVDDSEYDNTYDNIYDSDQDM